MPKRMAAVLILVVVFLGPLAAAAWGEGADGGGWPAFRERVFPNPAWLNSYRGHIYMLVASWDESLNESLTGPGGLPVVFRASEFTITDQGMSVWQAAWICASGRKGPTELSFYQHALPDNVMKYSRASDGEARGIVDKMEAADLVRAIRTFFQNPFGDLIDLPQEGSEVGFTEAESAAPGLGVREVALELKKKGMPVQCRLLVETGTPERVAAVTTSEKVAPGGGSISVAGFGAVLEWLAEAEKSGQPVVQTVYTEQMTMAPTQQHTMSEPDSVKKTLIRVTLEPGTDNVLCAGFDGIQGEKLKVVDYIKGQSYEAPGGPNGGAAAEFMTRIDTVSAPFCGLLSRDLAAAYPAAFAFNTVKPNKSKLSSDSASANGASPLEALISPPSRSKASAEPSPVNAAGLVQLSALIQDLSGKMKMPEVKEKTEVTRRAFEPPNESDKAPARATLTMMGIIAFVLGIVGGLGILFDRRKNSGRTPAPEAAPAKDFQRNSHNG